MLKEDQLSRVLFTGTRDRVGIHPHHTQQEESAMSSNTTIQLHADEVAADSYDESSFEDLILQHDDSDWEEIFEEPPIRKRTRNGH